MNATNGSSDFAIGELFSRSWHLVKGYKGTFWGALLLLILANLIVWGVLACIGYYAINYGGFDKKAVESIESILRSLICLPLVVGLTILGIKRASGLPTKAMSVFQFYPYILGLIGVYILQSIIFGILGILIVLSIIGFTASHIIVTILCVILAIIFGIVLTYLSIGYAFTLPVRIEKRVSLWQSLEVSRKGVTPHWFKVLFVFLICVFWTIVGIIPLLIGLIWVLPFVNIAVGELYVRLFGPINSDNLME